MLRRDPHQLGYEQSRWTLASLLQSCPWLRLTSPAGLCQLLDRLGIRYKRGRDYVHSPDAHYQDKLALIEQCRQQAQAHPERYVRLYLDEFTDYRQPTLSRAYERKGQAQPRACRSHQRNSWFRVVAALNALTGQVTYRQRSKIDVVVLGEFLAALCADYPQAQLIYVVVDHWPVHFHPDVLAALQPQRFPWPPYVPAHGAASRRPKYTDLPVALLGLPTDASWCNPIEKLWRWLQQQKLHLHHLSEDWPALKQEVATFLDRFQRGSPELLRYTGLLLA